MVISPTTLPVVVKLQTVPMVVPREFFSSTRQ
jgi:hypothetical protein